MTDVLNFRQDFKTLLQDFSAIQITNNSSGHFYIYME